MIGGAENECGSGFRLRRSRLRGAGRLALRELSCSAGGSDVGCGFFQDGWGGLDFADDSFWLGDGVEVAGVGAGELEAVEQAEGVLEIDLVGG